MVKHRQSVGDDLTRQDAVGRVHLDHQLGRKDLSKVGLVAGLDLPVAAV